MELHTFVISTQYGVVHFHILINIKYYFCFELIRLLISLSSRNLAYIAVIEV